MSRVVPLLPVAALAVLAAGSILASDARGDVAVAAGALLVVGALYVAAGRRRGAPSP